MKNSKTKVQCTKGVSSGLYQSHAWVKRPVPWLPNNVNINIKNNFKANKHHSQTAIFLTLKP